jgi:hypothetical protein
MTSHSAERVRRDGRSGETRFKRGSRNAEFFSALMAYGLNRLNWLNRLNNQSVEHRA